MKYANRVLIGKIRELKIERRVWSKQDNSKEIINDIDKKIKSLEKAIIILFKYYE